ncbi:hypothetical protein NUM3379_06710 [Kineococcus sp. NUM-3379]
MPRTCSSGDVFGVPLPGGGYAVGLIARVSRQHRGILLGFFFGPRRSELPAVDGFLPGSPDDAVLVCMFGGRLIRQGTWPKLGRLEGWEPHQWEVTRFLRQPSMGPSWIVTYDAEDPSVRLASVVADPDDIDASMPSEDLVGWGQLPRMLDERLPLTR